MPNALKVVIAQIKNRVGDIEGNTEVIIQAALAAKAQGADLVLFPELALTGYPPEDLLLRPGFHERVNTALERLEQAISGIATIIGHPDKQPEGLYNAASYFSGENTIKRVVWHKQHLPNYSIFDEKRYFIEGRKVPAVVKCNGVKISCLICEDIWSEDPIKQVGPKIMDCLIVINASPFHHNKFLERRALLQQRVKAGGVPLFYVHSVGAQDELVFDGGSMVLSAAGEVVAQAPFFKETNYSVVLEQKGNGYYPSCTESLPLPSANELVYRALVLAVRDYVQDNGFSKVLIGASGGIDSALTLAIAVDALGPENVTAVSMPSRFSAQLSADLAYKQAKLLGITYKEIAIEPIHSAFLAQLSPLFSGLEVDETEENLQARARGTLLMALSNKFEAMVLTTGNKSEMAVGYCTLYGDMAGGYAVLKDVFKTNVYALSEYRNTVSAAIPQEVIDRPPTAELRPDQLDSDSLPGYDILDKILEAYVEGDESVEQIAKQGIEKDLIIKIIGLVDRNEYKRRQAPPGVRVTSRAFGRDRRYPITSGYGLNITSESQND